MKEPNATNQSEREIDHNSRHDPGRISMRAHRGDDVKHGVHGRNRRHYNPKTQPARCGPEHRRKQGQYRKDRVHDKEELWRHGHVLARRISSIPRRETAGPDEFLEHVGGDGARREPKNGSGHATLGEGDG